MVYFALGKTGLVSRHPVILKTLTNVLTKSTTMEVSLLVLGCRLEIRLQMENVIHAM